MARIREPRIVHPLPPAPDFVGRSDLLGELEAWWRSDSGGVLALSALGGAGKTALVAEFLKRLGQDAGQPEAEGLFVWSFYESPAPDQFITELHDYVCGGSFLEVARGIALVFPVNRALADAGRLLVVLDGLEKLQRDQSAREGFGHIPDGSLRLLLKRLALGDCPARALITTRFPLADFEEWDLPGARVLDVSALDAEAARTLLRRQGVAGADEDLDRLSVWHGGHALTVDQLGALLARHGDGSPSAVSELVEPVSGGESRDPQSLRLGRVLSAVESRLPAEEAELLKRIAVFRTPVADAFLRTLCAPPAPAAPSSLPDALAGRELAVLVQSLADRHLVIVLEEDVERRYALHPAVRDHFLARLGRDASDMHARVGVSLASLVDAPENVRLDEDTLRALGEVFFHSVRSGALTEAGAILERMGGSRELVYDRGLVEFVEDLFRESFDFHMDLDGATLPPGLVSECFADWISARMILGRTAPSESVWAHAGLRPYLEELRGERPVNLNRELGSAWSMPAMRAFAFADPKAFLSAVPGVREGDEEARLDLVIAEAFFRLAESDALRDTAEAERRLRSAVRRARRTGERDLLVLGFIVQARRELASKSLREANSAIEAGLEAAEDSGFRLFLCDLYCLKAIARFRAEDRSTSSVDARTALDIAREVAYAPGEIEAMRVLADNAQDLFEKADLRRAADVVLKDFRDALPVIPRYEEDDYFDLTARDEEDGP